jgi:isoleucyl-tRNA synthetase
MCPCLIISRDRWISLSTPEADADIPQYEDRAFRVVADTYVTDTSGTGIVHQSPAFGEDDHRIAVANGIVRDDELPPCPLDEAGRFTAEVPDYQGRNVKVSRTLISFLIRLNFHSGSRYSDHPRLTEEGEVDSEGGYPT